MKKINNLLILFLLSSFTLSANTYDLRFTNVQLSGNQYCATAQIKAQTVSFEAGSASVFFTYNLKAIQQPTAKALNFGTATLCNEQENYNHSFNTLEYNGEMGEGNYAILLKQSNTGCPTIHQEWVDIAEFCFEVVDKNEEANLAFHERYTAFNTHENNGTLLTKGTFEAVDAPLVSSNQTVTNANLWNVQLLPNIASEQVNVQLTVPTNAEISITIFDRLGRAVQTKQLSALTGQHTETLTVSDLPKGYYLVNITDGKQTISEKLIVM